MAEQPHTPARIPARTGQRYAVLPRRRVLPSPDVAVLKEEEGEGGRW